MGDCKDSIIKMAQEIDKIDSKSTLFRYPTGKDGQKQEGANQIFNLPAMQKTFEELYDTFETISYMFSALDTPNRGRQEFR